MLNVTGLRCMRCGTHYAPNAVDYLCVCRPNVGSDLGTLDVEYDYAAVADAGSWEAWNTLGNLDEAQTDVLGLARFTALLPIVSTASLPPLPVGATPLLSARRLAADLGLKHLWIKDDGRNPSGSLKDRASAVAVAKCVELTRQVVATASTGNAAAALAQMAAAKGIPCVIFVPHRAPPAKIAQLLAFGATVFAVQGSYDQAFDLCVAACAKFGWYNRNTGMNPYMSEGKKTVSYEIASQLARVPGMGESLRYRAPDAVFVPVGDGCIIGGVYKGFYDLLQLGWIEAMPRIYGVQSELSAALYHAWRSDAELPKPVHATTRADSISVDAPRDALKALRAVRSSKGAFVQVPDVAILESIPALAQRAGVFAEPAGAAALAGCRVAREQGLITEGDRVVILNTGNGLKDIAAVRDVTGAPTEIEPRLEAVADAVAKLKLA